MRIICLPFCNSYWILVFLICPASSFTVHNYYRSRCGQSNALERTSIQISRTMTLAPQSPSLSLYASRRSVTVSQTGINPPSDTKETDSLQQRRAKSWILLVDDEESIRNAVGSLFRSQGYQHVTSCSDGEAALQMALSQNVTVNDDESVSSFQQRVPDCIVSDIRMPGMDGMELLRRIREHDILGQVPVVLLTAKGLTQDRIAGYDSGADAYLSKPFAPEELVAIVDNVIQRHEVLTATAEQQKSKNNVKIEDLKRDLDEIKNMLLQKGGGTGIGNGGMQQQTDIVLSEDELEVLQLLSQGLMNKEIAAQAHLSTRRIEQILTGMFRKAGVKNRTELVRWAVSTGHVQ